MVKQCRAGGANIEYALFLAAMSILVLSGVAILGDQFRPQLVAWRQGVNVDDTLTGSVKKDGETETYRIYKLPPGLQNKGE